MAGTQRGPFDVIPTDLELLTADDAVYLVRDLLLTEAKRIGIPVTGVNVPFTVNIPDGGIDAELVIPAAVVLPAGLIGPGKTSYQIKTGDFHATSKTDIKALVLSPPHRRGNKPIKLEHMQPRVRSCLEAGGEFVMVLVSDDLVGKEDEYGEKQIRAFLKDIHKKFAKARIRIVRANQLCAAITALSPGLALKMNRLGGSSGSPLHGLEYLEQSCGLVVDKYKPTQNLTESIVSIRGVAEARTGFKHIRILGDAGAGLRLQRLHFESSAPPAA